MKSWEAQLPLPPEPREPQQPVEWPLVGEGTGRQAGRLCRLPDITPPSNHVVAPTVQMWKLRLSLGLARGHGAPRCPLPPQLPFWALPLLCKALEAEDWRRPPSRWWSGEPPRAPR